MSSYSLFTSNLLAQSVEHKYLQAISISPIGFGFYFTSFSRQEKGMRKMTGQSGATCWSNYSSQHVKVIFGHNRNLSVHKHRNTWRVCVRVLNPYEFGLVPVIQRIPRPSSQVIRIQSGVNDFWSINNIPFPVEKLRPRDIYRDSSVLTTRQVRGSRGTRAASRGWEPPLTVYPRGQGDIPQHLRDRPNGEIGARLLLGGKRESTKTRVTGDGSMQKGHREGKRESGVGEIIWREEEEEKSQK